jgi:hypothetical protein
MVAGQHAPADVAAAAALARRLRAGQRQPQRQRRPRLADAGRPVEQIGVGQTVTRQGAPEHRQSVLLTGDLGQGHRSAKGTRLAGRRATPDVF